MSESESSPVSTTEAPNGPSQPEMAARDSFWQSPSFWLLCILLVGLAIFVWFGGRMLKSSFDIRMLSRLDEAELQATLRKHFTDCEWIRISFEQQYDAPVGYFEIRDKESLERLARALTVAGPSEYAGLADAVPIRIETSEGMQLLFHWGNLRCMTIYTIQNHHQDGFVFDVTADFQRELLSMLRSTAAAIGEDDQRGQDN